MKKDKNVHEPKPRICHDEFESIQSGVDEAILDRGNATPLEKHFANELSILRQQSRLSHGHIQTLDESIDDLERREVELRMRVAGLEAILDRLTWGSKKLWFILAATGSVAVGVFKLIDFAWNRLSP